MRSWLICPLLLASLTGCLSDDEVVGSGKYITREIEVAPFKNIAINTALGRLYIDQGDKSSFRVEADENLVNLFTADFSDSTLTIQFNHAKKITPSRPIKFYATMQAIESLAINGNSTVQSHGTLKVDKLNVKIAGSGSVALDIKGKGLELSIAGSGDANVKGVADEQTIKISGSGSYHGQDLQTKVTKITVNGSGDALVDVGEQLTAAVYGSGTVRYKGHPKLEKSIEGSGSIISMD